MCHLARLWWNGVAYNRLSCLEGGLYECCLFLACRLMQMRINIGSIFIKFCHIIYIFQRLKGFWWNMKQVWFAFSFLYWYCEAVSQRCAVQLMKGVFTDTQDKKCCSYSHGRLRMGEEESSNVEVHANVPTYRECAPILKYLLLAAVETVLGWGCLSFCLASGVSHSVDISF